MVLDAGIGRATLLPKPVEELLPHIFQFRGAPVLSCLVPPALQSLLHLHVVFSPLGLGLWVSLLFQ